MSKYVYDTAAAKSISAYAIMKGTVLIAKVTAHYANSGNVLVNVAQWGESVIKSYNTHAGTKLKTKPEDYESYDAYRKATDICESFQFQHKMRGGMGYDKFAAAIGGMIIDGHRIADHCGNSLSPKKKDNGLFPRGFKSPKGFTLANYIERSAATGKRMNIDSFFDKAMANLGFHDDEENTDENMLSLRNEKRRLYTAWAESADFQAGYTSCFQESGLKYLSSLGYNVIQVI